MAGVAMILKARGLEVSGCDLHPGARTRWLEANGVKVFEGHDPSHLDGIDELIVTPAVPASNPELAKARTGSVRIRMRGEVLAELVGEYDGIAVCGTHGKTTTSTFIAKLLAILGDSPSKTGDSLSKTGDRPSQTGDSPHPPGVGWCIGGETGEMPVAHIPEKWGQSPKMVFVVEADESDGTLALYHPKTLVLNAVDFDHLEHFSSEEAYFDCYRRAIAQTQGGVIVSLDHRRAADLVLGTVSSLTGTVPQKPGVDPAELGTVPKVTTFGFDERADVRFADWPEIAAMVKGRHNISNALGAVAVALSRGYSKEAIIAALPKAVAELPDRRFELVAESAGVKVVTDYAHHPAELKCAVDMARAEAGRGRVIALFQPHRYSRTKALQADFPSAFEGADEIVLIPVYPAFEEPIEGGDIADLYAKFAETRHNDVILARSAREAWVHARLKAASGDVVLLAGAGDIINLVPEIKRDMMHFSTQKSNYVETDLSRLSFYRTGGKSLFMGTVPNFKESGTASLKESGTISKESGTNPIIIGMGSNTWMPDCWTDRPVVKASGNAAEPGAKVMATRPALAFMAGIPGTFGGWVKMNAGAFGHSIGEFVKSVTLSDGRRLSGVECGFGYRTSAIDGLIEEVELDEKRCQTPQEWCQTPEKRCQTPENIHSVEYYISKRKVFPPRTCGSVFKNPPGDFAGHLLEEAGVKSMRVGGAYVWEGHANVIAAGEGCNSSDILALARLMARKVYFRFGIVLEPEVRGLETGLGTVPKGRVREAGAVPKGGAEEVGTVPKGRAEEVGTVPNGGDLI